jgi:MFS family permease
MALTDRYQSTGSAAEGSLLRYLVWGLAVTQTVGYGVLYYAFAVVLSPIARDLHTSTAAVTGAMTLSVVVAAAVGVPYGRWLDRHGGRTLMTAGSLAGVAAVLAWSRIDQLWQLYAAFVLIGASSPPASMRPPFRSSSRSRRRRVATAPC